MLHQFRITPKMVKRSNGTLLTPEMEIIVTINSYDPFCNGAYAVKDEYMRVWGYDYEHACASRGWFDVEQLH